MHTHLNEQDILKKINKISFHQYTTFYEKNEYGDNVISIILKFNKTKKLNFKNQQILEIINITSHDDPKIYFHYFYYIIQNNKTQNLNFTNDEIFQIIQKIDLNMTDNVNNSPLMLILLYNKTGGLYLNTEQIWELIQKSDLNRENVFKSTPLKRILDCNQQENLNLSDEQIVWIGERSNLDMLTYEKLEQYKEIEKRVSEKKQLNNLLFEKTYKKTII